MDGDRVGNGQWPKCDECDHEAAIAIEFNPNVEKPEPFGRKWWACGCCIPEMLTTMLHGHEAAVKEMFGGRETRNN